MTEKKVKLTSLALAMSLGLMTTIWARFINFSHHRITDVV